MDAKGGYSNKNKKVLMCAVATREYSVIKEILERIDNEVFFLITDTYEVYGGDFWCKVIVKKIFIEKRGMVLYMNVV